MIDPESTRVVRSWLADGADRLPERVLDAVLDQVPSTPQRRPWRLAWRINDVTNLIRFAAIAAVVVAVGVVGFQLLPSSGATVGAPPTASAPPAQSPAPSGSPSATANAAKAHFLARADVGGDLEAGDWTVDAPFAKSFTFTLPDGYRLNALTSGEMVIQGPSGSLGIYLVDKVVPDPCTAAPAIDTPTAAAIVSAFERMVGFERGLVSPTTVGGRSAETFALTNSIDTATAGCSRGEMLPLFHVSGATDEPATNGGTEQLFWVVQGRAQSGLGTRAWEGPIVIVAEASGSLADRAALDGIVRSIALD